MRFVVIGILAGLVLAPAFVVAFNKFADWLAGNAPKEPPFPPDTAPPNGA